MRIKAFNEKVKATEKEWGRGSTEWGGGGERVEWSSPERRRGHVELAECAMLHTCYQDTLFEMTLQYITGVRQRRLCRATHNKVHKQVRRKTREGSPVPSARNDRKDENWDLGD